MTIVKIYKRNAKHFLPKYQTKGSAGVDLHASLKEKEKLIEPNQRVLIPTGIYLSMPENIEAQIRPRSGLALEKGITVLNSPGTIDPDYRGELKVILINHSLKNQIIKNNMRIAQLVFCPIIKISFLEVEELDLTERSDKGFGSTGDKN